MTSRIVVLGGPRTGKTTYADARGLADGVTVRHTDDLIGTFDWSGVSEHVASDWFGQPGPWIIEGVAAVRALRKWMKANPEGAPCDEVVVLTTPHVPLTKGQAGMAKSCATIWAQVEPALRSRGVAVVR